jgi:hypothetical protein
MMRWIEPHEPCYTASEIVEMFKDQTGVVFYPTVVGQIAKKRDLDYIETEEEIIDSLGKQRVVTRRKYGKGDLPVIFADLQDKADQRVIYETAIQKAYEGSYTSFPASTYLADRHRI